MNEQDEIEERREGKRKREKCIIRFLYDIDSPEK